MAPDPIFTFVGSPYYPKVDFVFSILYCDKTFNTLLTSLFDIHDVKLTSTSLFSHINSTDSFPMCVICFNFPITVSVLQNNDRGFPFIFTITVVESIFYGFVYAIVCLL
jgi:hypothetical protein